MRAARSTTPYFYPISIDLEYRLPLSTRGAKTGHGRTVRLSSASIQFESEDYLPPGSTLEMLIAWPARLENAVALQLFVRGRTVRSRDRLITLEILCYEFRTRRQAFARANSGASPTL